MTLHENKPLTEEEKARLKAEVKASAVQRLERDFSYHAPQPGQSERYEHLRDKAKEFALLINELTPSSREQSLAFTALQEATMWTNAAIAREE